MVGPSLKTGRSLSESCRVEYANIQILGVGVGKNKKEK